MPFSIIKSVSANKLNKIQKQYIKQILEERHKIHLYNKLIKSFPLKPRYKSIIPLHLYTCWHTKDLPPLMRKNYERLVQDNNAFTFHLYDENECREFIKTHFRPDVLHAYDSLIPCAYKADLWRYCVLFIKGGIYLDIKFSCINGFKLIALTEQQHFVKDRPDNCVYNALIAALPGNVILYNCIRQIVEHVKNKHYGVDWLEPTGPRLLGRYFTNKKFNLYYKTTEIENKINEYYIIFNDGIILKQYKGYREEQNKHQKNLYYPRLWERKNIYNDL